MENKCLDYTCPITIPTSAAGATGPAGDDGTDGAAFLDNTLTGMTVASGTVGTTTLKSYTLGAAEVAAGDAIDLEAQLSIVNTATLVGSIFIDLGTTTIVTMDIDTAVESMPSPPGGANNVITLRATIRFVSPNSQIIKGSYEMMGMPSYVQELVPATATENCTAANTIALKATTTSISATLTCNYFTVTKYKI